MTNNFEPHTEKSTFPDLNNVLPTTSSGGRPRGKPFEPGNRQGKGRFSGSRNKRTLLLQESIDDYGEPIIRRVLKMAMEGDRAAMKLVMERLIPIAQDNRVELRLPAVRCAADLTKVSSTLIRALSRGDISVEHAKAIAEVLQAHGRLIESEDLDRRVAALEQRGSATGDVPALEVVMPQTDPLPKAEESADGH